MIMAIIIINNNKHTHTHGISVRINYNTQVCTQRLRIYKCIMYYIIISNNLVAYLNDND